MRWIPTKLVRIIVFSIIAAAPFVVAFLLLPDEDGQPSLDAAQVQPRTAGSPVPLEFPFASPSDLPVNAEPAPAPEPSPSASPITTQCSNRRDDDRDGRIDLADPGCSSRNDNSEAPDPSPKPSPSASASPPAEPSPEPLPNNCNDNFDNDGDGLPDGADPGCDDGDNNELPFNQGGDANPAPCEGPFLGCKPSKTTTTTTVPPTTTQPKATSETATTPPRDPPD